MAAVDDAALLEHAASGPERRRRRLAAPLAGALELLVVPAILLAGWQIAAMVVGDVAVATPADTVDAVMEGLRDGWLVEGLETTAVATLISFGIAVGLGGALGLAFGLSRFWGQVFESPLLWIYSIPKIALYPIFLLFLGLTLEARVAFAVFHGFIPLALILMNGVRSVPAVYLKVARVYRMSRARVFTRVILPSCLPAAVVGLRYCFSLTFLGVVLAEMFAASEGTGYELLQAISLHRVPQTFGIALVLVLIALAVNAAFMRLTTMVEQRQGASGPAARRS